MAVVAQHRSLKRHTLGDRNPVLGGAFERTRIDALDDGFARERGSEAQKISNGSPFGIPKFKIVSNSSQSSSSPSPSASLDFSCGLAGSGGAGGLLACGVDCGWRV